MALTKQRLLHKRSSIEGRILAPSALTYGELAINFASGANKSFLEIKKSDDTTALYFEHPYATFGNVASGTTAGEFSTSISGITEYYDGLTIRVRLGMTYNSSWNTLNVNGLGPKMIWYRYNGRMTSHFGQWAELFLTYRTDAGTFQATATARGLVSGQTYTDGWVATYTYLDGNDIYRIYDYYSPRKVGNNKVWAYKFLAIDVNGNVQPLVLDSGTGTSKTVNTTPFRPEKIYQNGGSDYASGGTIGHTTLMHCGYLSTPHYTFNETLTTYKTVYLKGTLDATTGLFTLSSGKTDFYRFVPNNTNNLVLSDYFEEGFYYIRLGNSYTSNNYMYLEMVNPMYYFNGTGLVEIKPTAVNALNSYTKQEIDEAQEVVAQAINDLNDRKQDKLVSGQNIKTIGGQSILGAGDLSISGVTVETANSAQTLTHTITLKQNTTTVGTWNGSDDKTVTFSDSATTYAGHYTPSNNATATTSGARITGITKDGKGHIISIATAATDNTDTATTETGHYTPSTTASTEGSTGAGNFIKTITLDSKKHVLAITSGTALTSYTEASVAISNSGQTNNSPQSVVYGAVTGGTKGHSITLQRTNKVYSASTADSARTAYSASTALSASTAGKLAGTLNIYKNGTLLTTYDGSSTLSALTTDTNPSVTAGTVGTGVVTGITASGTSNHAIVGLKTTLVKVNSATTTDNVSAVAANGDAYRNIWFSDSATETKRTNDTDFQYNPNKNAIKVSAVTMNGSNLIQVPNKAGTFALTSDIDSALAGSVNYKGATATLPSSSTTGDLWITTAQIALTAAQSATGAAQTAETGDFIIARESGKWDVVQKNIDGAVTTTATTLTDGNVIVGKGNRTIGVSSYTIAKSVPSTALFTDSATTYAGHYTPSSDSTGTTSGARITGITKDGKGHIISIATAATDNTDTATTETGHYSPTGKTNSVGVATAGSFLKQVFYDSKGHVTSATTGTALTSFTETQLSYSSGSSVSNTASAVMTGLTVSNHAITYGKTNKIFSATTADSARTLTKKLTVYNNGVSVGSFDGSAVVSALTTDEKIKTATATTKAYIVGKAAVADTSTGITHANVYMSGGALYSEGAKVSTTDTKVTDANSSGKTFLLGHATQGTNATAQTYTDVYMSAGTIAAKEYKIDEKAVMKYNTTNQCIDFIFI